MIYSFTICGDLFIYFEPMVEFSLWIPLVGYLLERVNIINILELKVSLQLHTINFCAFKHFEIQPLLICWHRWHQLWFAYVFVMNHLHSPAPFKALSLEMSYVCFVYDKDLFTPWLRPWEKDFFLCLVYSKADLGVYILRFIEIFKIFNWR